MYQLFNLHDADTITDVPPEVIQYAKNALYIIEKEYGKPAANKDGGEVIILTLHDNLNVLNTLGIIPERLQPEYSNTIATSKGIEYLHVFTLRTNEYSVQYLLPKHLASVNMIEC